MNKYNQELNEIFSVGSNDSNPAIGEIRKKLKTQSSNVTIYKVVAYTCKKSGVVQIKIIDSTLTKAERSFIKKNFC